ncbi:hypothetical protein Nepgr_008816 [Nepenthes gracilis]|uniref:YqaJ viral recombinase domain-containing protein n=1 Tax=Nepenthes gracilis TaxID=150966 RepID=A0AAD3XJT9_NEPGR|nr:hypothetical protein Nepgr_008816 [Nepenthes gracilis]
MRQPLSSGTNITDYDVSFLGFAVHSQERFNWLGASPDDLLGYFPDGGILEVKCPSNKGKPELAFTWLVVPSYYMPQVQGQMEIKLGHGTEIVRRAAPASGGCNIEGHLCAKQESEHEEL